jgi:hypothetical protein
MKPPLIRPPRLLPFFLAFAFVANAAAASVIVNVSFLPTGTGTFLYSVAVTNDGPDDLSIVSLSDGPTFDSLIDTSLMSPTGFLASYDSGSGFVDFIEDTSAFTSGGTVASFTFESMAAPGSAFTMFEALDINGGSISGLTTLIPEPASSGLAVLTLLPFALRRRRVA